MGCILDKIREERKTKTSEAHQSSDYNIFSTIKKISTR